MPATIHDWRASQIGEKRRRRRRAGAAELSSTRQSQSSHPVDVVWFSHSTGGELMRRRTFMTLLGGAAVACPQALTAQQPARRYRVGYLALIPGEDKTLMRALLERLSELGLGESNMKFTYRSAEGHPERLTGLAAELLVDQPDVLVAGFGTLAAQAAKAATGSVPVVFTTVGDPLGAKLITSLNRPGGNVTGLTDQARDVQGKRLQLLLDLVPGKPRIAALLNPTTPFSQLALQEAAAAAEQARIRLDVLEASTTDQIIARIENLGTVDTAGLLILEDPLIYSIREKIAELSTRLRLPTIFVYKDSVEAGGLMSYGPDRPHIYRRAAEFVEKILKGTKPADLPVEQPTKFELVINLKTAKAIGLTVPPTLLAIADEVIE
ncbi:MAG: ABC transporter substrate-binding protein [Proteobacteria bacterium]|nr:MAG: ABC transporter substrate-binding protein [Pseudomonadota bacterium]